MTVVCFVIHGIGKQHQGFSALLREGIKRQLQKLTNKQETIPQVEFYELYWAGVGSDEQDNLYSSIYPELYAKSGMIKGWLQLVHNLKPLRALTFRLVGDVFKYLGKFQKPIKESVLQKLVEVFKQKQVSQESFSLILVGHSLGTVALHDIISGFLAYRYAAFDNLVKSTSVFTMGSPISLFSLVADSAEPGRFRKWTNFLHPRDPIAFPMAGRFPTVKDVVLNAFSLNPLKSHSVYWTHTEVQKQIAAEILEHTNNRLGVVLKPEDLRNEVPPEIYQPFQTASTKVGFSQYLPNFNKVPFEELFSTKQQIDICLLYGSTWQRTNVQYIVGALEKAKTDMRICMLSPKSPSVAGITYQFGITSKDEPLPDRISRVTKALIQAHETATKNTNPNLPGRLRIYYSLNGVMHSFYRFDDLIYFAPRQMTTNSLAATPIPTLVFRGTYPPKKQDEMGYDMYSWLMRDFELLLAETKEAVLAYDSNNSIGASK
jgi:hypothetical protein